MSTTAIGHLLRGQSFACQLVRDRTIRIMRRHRECRPWDIEWLKEVIGEVGGIAGLEPDLFLVSVSMLMQQTKLFEDRLVENWEDPLRSINGNPSLRQRMRAEAAEEEKKKTEARVGRFAGVAQPLCPRREVV